MSRNLQGVEKQHEISRSRLIRDTRPLIIRMLASVGSPPGVLITGISLVFLALVAPALADLALLLALIFLLVPRKAHVEMPYRVPKYSGTADPNDLDPSSGKARPGRGIAFVGNRREDRAEFWEAAGDVQRHWFILGSTGAGKTEALVSMCVNSLIWASGLLYTDGKGQVDLFAKIFSLCRIFGREDDLLALNFMTGNIDTSRKSALKLSNSYNPFVDGNASSKTQLLVNLMDSGGDGKGSDVWKGRAISFISSIMPGLVDKRDYGGMLLHVGKIREYMPFLKLLELLRDPAVKQDSKTKIQAFLLDVPGYKSDKGEAQSNTFFEQYGYQQMQFTRILSSLADTYGHIFKTEQADVDMSDVVKNRRVLVNLLPALESSRPELGNLGKIIVAGIKGMMGSNLGSRVEGTKRQVLDSRATNAPTPFLTIFDEHGYYLTEDTALLWAQARSLNFWLISAGQDIQAYFRTSKEETKAIIANCNTKIVGKLEDPTETYEMIEHLGGEALISTVGDYDMDIDGVAGGYLEGKSVKVERVKRITLQDLQRQVEGEVHIMVSGDIIRGRMFYADPPPAMEYRLNHFIKVVPPSRETAEALRINTRALIETLLDPETAFSGLRPADPYFAYVGSVLRQQSVERYQGQRQGAERGICLLMGYVEQPIVEDAAQGAGGGPRNTPGTLAPCDDGDAVAHDNGSELEPAREPDSELQEFDAANLATVNVFEAIPIAADVDAELHAASAAAAAAVVEMATGGVAGLLGAAGPPAARGGGGVAMGAAPAEAAAAADAIVEAVTAATNYPNPPTPPAAEAAAERMQRAMDELESLLVDGGGAS